MNENEVCEMRRGMHKGVKMMLDTLVDFSKSKKNFSISEMMDVADMLKDMSEVEKNLAKANYYDRKAN